ncbi:MAG: hypothetical protein LBN42_00040 [Oscillospiraceae bacterium]|nr:hypothetical protein [Oscillospiraceae bacterium]
MRDRVDVLLNLQAVVAPEIVGETAFLEDIEDTPTELTGIKQELQEVLSDIPDTDDENTAPILDDEIAREIELQVEIEREIERELILDTEDDDFAE